MAINIRLRLTKNFATTEKYPRILNIKTATTQLWLQQKSSYDCSLMLIAMETKNRIRRREINVFVFHTFVKIHHVKINRRCMGNKKKITRFLTQLMISHKARSPPFAVPVTQPQPWQKSRAESWSEKNRLRDKPDSPHFSRAHCNFTSSSSRVLPFVEVSDNYR